jgi:hypothetical protein
MTKDPEVEQLIRDLSEPTGDAAEEAKFGLTSLGPRVVEPLIAAVRTLNRLGKLLAIEAFDELGDRRADPSSLSCSTTRETRFVNLQRTPWRNCGSPMRYQR